MLALRPIPVVKKQAVKNIQQVTVVNQQPPKKKSRKGK